ncbi:MAG: hypothetical protein WBU20_13655 [Candidatus Acidiferrum sp.]
MAQYETLSTPFSMLTQRLLQVVQPFCFAEWKKLQQLGGGLAAELEIVGAHVATELVAGEGYVEPAKRSAVPLIYNFRHHFHWVENALGKTLPTDRLSLPARTY